MSDLTSDLLSQFTWLKHGFGTRSSIATQSTMASLDQVHSNRVLVAETSRLERLGEADALVTVLPNLPISIRTADCLPILLVDSKTHAVAAIHAGWRGTAGGIVTHTIACMHAQFDTDPGNIYAAIGPGIGECCFEVGEEVAMQFGVGVNKAGKARVDLARVNRDQLVSAGVRGSHIHRFAHCTFCNPASFHSYRRDGHAAGRMISWIELDDEV